MITQPIHVDAIQVETEISNNGKRAIYYATDGVHNEEGEDRLVGVAEAYPSDTGDAHLINVSMRSADAASTADAKAVIQRLLEAIR